MFKIHDVLKHVKIVYIST